MVDVLGCIRYVLDLCWPELRIALEYDGYEAHEYRLEQDAQRDLDLERRGWITIRASAADLRDPGELISRLDDAFRVRGAGHYRPPLVSSVHADGARERHTPGTSSRHAGRGEASGADAGTGARPQLGHVVRWCPGRLSGVSNHPEVARRG